MQTVVHCIHSFRIKSCTSSNNDFIVIKVILTWSLRLLIYLFIFFPMPPPVLMNFVVFPPGCGYSVADFWGRGAHEARLRCPSDVSGDLYMKMRYQDGPLILSLLTPWSPWGSCPTRKNPHGRTGSRTRDLIISSQKPWTLDHEPGRITEI